MVMDMVRLTERERDFLMFCHLGMSKNAAQRFSAKQKFSKLIWIAYAYRTILTVRGIDSINVVLVAFNNYSGGLVRTTNS
jgi:hypothetical protein